MIFRFENPSAFQFIWLLPVLLVLAVWLIRRGKARIQKSLGPRLAPFLTSSVSSRMRYFKLSLEIMAVVLFILALARPQSGQTKTEVKSQGVEMILAVDVSNSMMAEDVKPNRLEHAKQELARFLDVSTGDRVGIVAFAGSAVLLSPITTDKSALRMFLDSLTTDSVTTQGTHFKNALTESQDAFKRGGLADQEDSYVTRVILIASDGEDNELGAVEKARALAKDGIRIFALAFGTEEGAPIPVYDRNGNLRGYKRNEEGRIITSQTKGTVLKNLADVGQGSFYHATFGGGEIPAIRNEIDKLEKSEFESSAATDYEEEYQIFLVFGLALALIELILGERRALKKGWRGRFEVQA